MKILRTYNTLLKENIGVIPVATTYNQEKCMKVQFVFIRERKVL